MLTITQIKKDNCTQNLKNGLTEEKNMDKKQPTYRNLQTVQHLDIEIPR